MDKNINFTWFEYTIRPKSGYFLSNDKNKKIIGTKWKWIKEEDLPTLFKYRHSDIFRSVWSYEKPDLNSKKIGDFHIDFDAKDNIKKAQYDAIKIINDLETNYNINSETLSIGFSGSKGFFIIIPASCFLTEIIDKPELVYKKIGIFFKLGAPTLDLSTYKKRGMWRITNSIHQKTGLYRIELTFEEIKNLCVEEIIKLAHKQKWVKHKAPELSVELNTIIKKLQKYKKKFEIVKIYAQRNKGSFYIPYSMRQSHFPSDRNHALTRLAGIYKKNKAPYNEAKKLILYFNEKYCSPSKTEKEALLPLNYYYKK